MASNAQPEPFDRCARRNIRDRAARRFDKSAFLKDAILQDLVSRFEEFALASPRVLDLGSHDGRLAAHLPEANVIAADAGFCFAKMAHGVMCDEDRLPFAAKSFDAVMSAASLHGVNDLPGALVQTRQILRPGGVFLAAFVGGASLQDLRGVMIAAEDALVGGASPRLLPMIDPREAPALLQRAGFADPVVDVHRVTVYYRTSRAMLDDLRASGESNILAARARTPMPRRLVAALTAAVENAKDNDGRIAANLEIVTMTARAP